MKTFVITNNKGGTGKTTLSKLLAEASHYSAENIFFYDFEDKHLRALFDVASLNALKALLDLEGIDSEEKNLIIFDEIQHLRDPSNLLKLLHDHFTNIKIIATGSSSLQIKSKFSDSLAGRKRVYRVEPLSFNEYLLFTEQTKLLHLRKIFKEQEDRSTLISLALSYKDDFLRVFEEYLLFGGYPEVVLLSSKEEKIRKLDSIASSYIQKDIREIANIDNIDAYNKLLKYLAINSGSQFNLSSVRETIGISSVTLQKYLLLLQETFVVAELAPFFTNKNKEISKLKKIFYKDTGVRNLQIANFNAIELRTDNGALYENYIFNALEHNRNVLQQNYFYRTQSKSEIDFITSYEDQYTLIEVKSGYFSKTPKAMKEFEKKYDGQLTIKEKIVINRSHLDLAGDIKFLPAYLF